MGRSFSEGLARFYTNGSWGWVDRTGTIAIKPSYEDTEDFCEGLAAVKQGRWGYIDRHGNLAIGYRYQNASSFRDGRARVQIGGKWGYIDKTGMFLIFPKFNFLGELREGVGLGKIDTKLFAIGSDGHEKFELPFPYATNFNEGLIAVGTGNQQSPRWGYLDRQGQIVIEPQFDRADAFSEGIAAVRTKDGKWGYIDRSGAWVIPPRFIEARAFIESIAEVTVGTEIEVLQTYIRKNGTYLWSPKSSPP